MERCSWPSRWAAVGMLGIPPGPTTCPLPGTDPCPAEGNACSSAGLISGPCAIARGHEVTADREAEAARWTMVSACLTGSFSLEVGGSAVDACKGKVSEPKPLACLLHHRRSAGTWLPSMLLQSLHPLQADM